MDKEYTVHLEGFLNTNYDGELALDDNWSMLSEDIANELKDDEMSHYKEQDQYCTNVTSYYPTVGMSLYVSEVKTSFRGSLKKKSCYKQWGQLIFTQNGMAILNGLLKGITQSTSPWVIMTLKKFYVVIRENTSML